MDHALDANEAHLVDAELLRNRAREQIGLCTGRGHQCERPLDHRVIVDRPPKFDVGPKHIAGDIPREQAVKGGRGCDDSRGVRRGLALGHGVKKVVPHLRRHRKGGRSHGPIGFQVNGIRRERITKLTPASPHGAL